MPQWKKNESFLLGYSYPFSNIFLSHLRTLTTSNSKTHNPHHCHLFLLNSFPFWVHKHPVRQHHASFPLISLVPVLFCCSMVLGCLCSIAFLSGINDGETRRPVCLIRATGCLSHADSRCAGDLALLHLSLFLHCTPLPLIGHASVDGGISHLFPITIFDLADSIKVY